jgi:hypothetical protein
MLRVIYSMLKNNRPYYDPEVDYEALMVQRNAPRWIKALNKNVYLPRQAAAQGLHRTTGHHITHTHLAAISTRPGGHPGLCLRSHTNFHGKYLTL